MNTEQLKLNVQRLALLQSQLKINDSQFCRRYLRGISGKTWTHRLKVGKFDEISARMGERVAAVVSGVEHGSPDELAEFSEALPFARALAARVELLRGQSTDRRCLVVLATTGVGKSWAARHDRQLNPEDTILLEIRPAWRNKPLHILRGLASRLGVQPEGDAATQLDAIIVSLCAAPKVIYFDEGHEGGLALLKIIKSLINETSSRFVYMAYPSEWQKMLKATDGTYAEAQQLVGRSLKPVFDAYRAGTTAADVRVWLERVAGLTSNTGALAKELWPLIKSNFGLRTLSDALADAREQADEDGGEVAELLVPAVRDLCHAPAPKPVLAEAA